MERLRCNENIRPFTHRRGFHREVIHHQVYDSWSDSSLWPGLRHMLHQLRDHRTPHNGRNDYCYNILCTVSGLDYEFNKLEHLLSTREKIRNRKTSTSLLNEISYIDFAVKSLLELTFCLKDKLRVQVEERSNVSFGTVNQTSKLVGVLENKLCDLLEKLDNCKVSGRNLGCKICSEHLARPLINGKNCTRKNTIGSSNPSCQDRRVKYECLDFLHDSKGPISLNRPYRASKTGFKRQQMQSRQPKLSMAKDIKNYNHFSNRTPISDGQRIQSVFGKSKTSEDLHMEVYGHLNDNMTPKVCPNSKKSKNVGSFCCFQNQSHEFKCNFPHNEINNRPMVQAGTKTATRSQHGTLSRKRAGKDGSEIYYLSDNKPDSYNNNRRFHKQTYTRNKNKDRNGHRKISDPKNKRNMLSRRASLKSNHSDQSSSKGDDVSDSIFTEKVVKSTQTIPKHNRNRTRKKYMDRIEKYYISKSRKQINKWGSEAPKYSSDRLSQEVNAYIPKNSNKIIKSDIGLQSLVVHRKNKGYFHQNGPYDSLNRNKYLKRRSKGSNINKISKQKPNNTGVYPSQLRGYRKRNARSNKSQAGIFFKRARHNLSKIRIFSTRPSKDLSKNDSSNIGGMYKGYRRNHKRQDIEYTNSHYPSRSRIRPLKSGRKMNIVGSSKYNLCSSSSSLTLLTFSDDNSDSCLDEVNSVSYDYPYFFERIPSSFEYASDLNTVAESEFLPCLAYIQNGPQSCDVSPQRSPEVCNQPPNKDCELANEYEIIFEKVDPKIKCYRPRQASTESSRSSESASLSEPEYKIVHQPRRCVRRNRLNRMATIKSKVSQPTEEVRHSKHKRHRKYIRIGTDKFLESTKKVLDYKPHQPAKEQFTYYPPVRDTYSRGTSTEVLPLHAQRTSTSDLIKLIEAIGTNTEPPVITRDKSVDPIPLQQKTPPVETEVKSKLTNTDQIDVHSMGTNTIPDSSKPPVVNKATDPLFYLNQKDKATSTAQEKKMHVTHVGTDPRPSEKLQQATKATDTIHHLGQQVKTTNTEPAFTKHSQIETYKKPNNVSMGTTTPIVRVQDQNTSYEKVITSSRGNNPIALKMLDKGFQYDIVEHKPSVKTAFTEALNKPGVGKTTQTSFTEKPTVMPSVHQVYTQTEKVRRKSPRTVLKQRKPSLSEQIAVVEAEEEISSPSALSMRLLFEKCQDEIYKRRTNVCKSRCSDYCDLGQRVVVCDNKRSKQLVLNSSSECNLSFTEKYKSQNSDVKQIFTSTKDPLTSPFTSDCDLQTVSTVNNSGQKRKPKLKKECGMIGNTNPITKKNVKSVKSTHTESNKKSRSTIEASDFNSSNTTLTSCDWKNIAHKIKLNNTA